MLVYVATLLKMYSTIIAAVSTDGFIADQSGISIATSPQDKTLLKAYLKKFNIHIMGRKTFEAHAGKHKLPTKQRIVWTSTPSKLQNTYGAIATFTDASFASIVKDLKEPFLVLGGSSIYQEALGSGYVQQIVVITEPYLVHAGIPFLPTTTLKANGFTCYKKQLLSQQGTTAMYYAKN